VVNYFLLFNNYHPHLKSDGRPNSQHLNKNLGARRENISHLIQKSKFGAMEGLFTSKVKMVWCEENMDD
jgi:hypothetical protein